MKVYGLGKQRVRCPFLTDGEECALYEKRPIICRVYGVPFSLKNGDKEQSYACNISGFQTKVTYPTVKLYKIYDELCKLSQELFKKTGSAHPEKATFMLPLSMVIKMPFEVIVKGEFEE